MSSTAESDKTRAAKEVLARALKELERAEQEDQRRAEREKKNRSIKHGGSGGNVLIPASPTKPVVTLQRELKEKGGVSSYNSSSRYNGATGKFDDPVKPKESSAYHEPVAPAVSSFLSRVQNVRSNLTPAHEIQRSKALAAKPAVVSLSSLKVKSEPPEEEVREVGNSRRDDQLMVVEDFKRGPREFGDGPAGDKNWETVEPNTGIRLSKRITSHSLVQDHLSDRYHVTPSQLYSIIRLSRDGSRYDVPLEGDWITIAVVAEQYGGIKVTKRNDVHDNVAHKKEGVKSEPQPQKSGGKKFVHFKLVCLPQRSGMGREVNAGGDSVLQLMLFEAESSSGEGSRKKYRGGSGGAYEKFWKLRVGTVVAIMNPRVLKPLSHGGPHPLTNPLALNPESAETIIEIGMSKDIGKCTAVKQDGNECSSWVDKRVNTICEYHLMSAAKNQRGRRAEFSNSTSAYGLSAQGIANKARGPPARGGTSSGVSVVGGSNTSSSWSQSQSLNGAYDPSKKWGLLPKSGMINNSDRGGGAVYAVGGGHTVGSSSKQDYFGQEFMDEKIGRNKQAALKRRRENEEMEKAWAEGLSKDQTVGGKNLRRIMKAKEKGMSVGNADGDLGIDDDGEDSLDEDGKKKRRRRPLAPEHLKKIGFDPFTKPGQKQEKETENDLRMKVDEISKLKVLAADKEVSFAPLAGAKHRSSVKIPDYARVKAPPAPPKKEEKFIDLDSDDDEDHAMPDILP